MAFVLPDGRPLALDTPFTWDEVQYPANWLRLASPDEREAIGITEVADPAPYDQRFYWGYDAEGALIPKDHAQLVTVWSDQTRTTAGALLTPSDWLVIREADNAMPVPDAWRTWRESIRTACSEKLAAIEGTLSTSELVEYITSNEYSSWPSDPNSIVGS